jgi:hypothetical protein
VSYSDVLNYLFHKEYGAQQSLIFEMMSGLKRTSKVGISSTQPTDIELFTYFLYVAWFA